MATPIVMPQMGYDMKEGRLVRWIKQEGEQIQRGEDLVEIETDKAVIPITATASGVLRKVLVEEGVTVPVGQPIGVVGSADEDIPAELMETTTTQSAPKSEANQPPQESIKPETAPVPASATAAPSEVRASPVARRLAQEKSVDLTLIQGTGPNGRVTERDVLASLESTVTSTTPESKPDQAPSAAPGQVVELSRMRQAIARLTTRSKQEIPHFYISVDVDMTAALAFRQDLNSALESRGVRISVNDLIIKATAVALQAHPTLNASYDGDTIKLHSAINIGIAIDMDGNGLLVPAIMGCESRSLEEIALASRDLVDRAGKDRLRPEEYTDSTFSISNMGMFDVDSFMAIIYPPHSAVLGVGTARPQPIVRDGQFAVAQIMRATLSVDHRVADGAGAARFLGSIKRLLEHPSGLLI